MRSRLLAATGMYVGRGDGPESGPFVARLIVGSAVDGRSATIDYEAWADDGELKHREHTLVTLDASGAIETLAVCCEELPGLTTLHEGAPGVYSNGVGIDGFSIEIRIELTDDRVHYAWSWAPPGVEMSEQSRAIAVRVADRA